MASYGKNELVIRKFLRIENVGKFRACKAAGNVELRSLSLIYAENGRGKTTICDILRSLRTGDGAYVLGRGTLGPAGTPTIHIRLDDSTVTFAERLGMRVTPVAPPA